MNLGPFEIAIIALVIILLFGARKLPDAARSLGRSMRIFKSEVKEMSNDDQRQEAAQAQQAQLQAPQAQPQAYPQQYGQAQQPYGQQQYGQAQPQYGQQTYQVPQQPYQQYPSQSQHPQGHQ